MKNGKASLQCKTTHVSCIKNKEEFEYIFCVLMSTYLWSHRNVRVIEKQDMIYGLM